MDTRSDSAPPEPRVPIAFRKNSQLPTMAPEPLPELASLSPAPAPSLALADVCFYHSDLLVTPQKEVCSPWPSRLPHPRLQTLCPGAPSCLLQLSDSCVLLNSDVVCGRFCLPPTPRSPLCLSHAPRPPQVAHHTSVGLHRVAEISVRSLAALWAPRGPRGCLVPSLFARSLRRVDALRCTD